MKLAVVGWAADCGVGRELIDAVANLPVSGAFVITHPTKRNRWELVPDAVRHGSYGRDPVSEMETFIEKVKPDVILTWEWPTRWEFVDVWKRHGIRWVNVVHWDWFPAENIQALRSAELIAPNRQCHTGLKAKYGLRSMILPVPIDITQFEFKERTEASRFGMVYAAGGPFGRRSLKEVLEAWKILDDPKELVVRAQVKPAEWIETPNVSLKVDNLWKASEVYDGFDVAVQPSKFEGVGLSLLEAQACGAPVITVDAAPMNELAPDLLVRADRLTVSTMKGHEVDCFRPSVGDIVERVRRLNGDMGELSRKARARAETYSWDILRPRWREFLGV